MAQIKIEGQTINLDDEIAESDDTLRAALQVNWPDAKTATFTRVDKRKDGGQLVVTVAKKAGTKGSVIDALLGAPEAINPAIAMSEQIAALDAAGQLDPEAIQAMMPQIEATAETGQRDLHAVDVAKHALLDAPSLPAAEIPMGF